MTIRDIVVAFGFEVDKNSEKQAESSIKGLKSMATKLLGGIAVVFSVSKIKSFAQDCVEAASSVQEMENKFDVVFDNMRDEVDQWAGEFANAVGRNKNAIKTYLADQQNLLVGFGMAREEGVKLAEEMTALALDIASFANQDEDVAVNAMTKAVMGESEAAKTLGAVLNDVTRAETMAAMGLSGNYNSLDQLTKMQVNYNAILRQSPDAVGDCVRSMDSYEARMRQLNSATAEFKEFVGGQLLPIFSVFVGWTTKGMRAATGFTKAIFLDKEENNRLLKVFDRMHAVIKRLQPASERFAQSMRNGIGKATDTVKAIADKLGGMENLLKILAVVAGAFLLVMNWGKIIGGARAFVTLLSGIGKMFGMAKLNILAVVAIVVALALIVEDFIHFLLGNDSIIGTIFDKAGIGADNARQAIFDAWNAIWGFLAAVWGEIQAAAHEIFDALSKWWAENGNGVLASFRRIWESIVTLCVVLWNGLSNGAKAIFSALKAYWDTWGETILTVFGILWNTMIALIQPFLDALAAVIDFLVNVFTGNWSGAWNSILDFTSAVWEAITAIITGAWDIICAVWDKLAEIFGNIFQSAHDAISGKVSEICNTIVNGFQNAVDWIRALPAQALQRGADIIDGIVNGINGSIGKVADAVRGVGEKIRSFLHFSVPDEGPLTDYESWMPDFMGGLADGISSSEGIVLDKIRSLAGGIRTLMSAATANAATAAVSTVNNTTSTVTQNVNIANSYSGGSAETQKNVSRAMKKSAADATTQMARGLAYTRG